MTLISKVLTHAISNLSRKNTGHDQEAAQMIKTKSRERKRDGKGDVERGRARFCRISMQMRPMHAVGKKKYINYNLQYSILENPKAKQLTSSMHACVC